jgi:1-acyl-sn-glycerol-3-phosphate acyltransferase
MPRTPLVYSVLKPVLGVALRWYYQQLTVTGLEKVPADGPIFLAVNHPNALVDALAVAWSVPRRVHFTAKATIFANPLVARFLHTAGVVPLRRAADEAKAAGGDVAVDPARNAASFDAVADALAEGAAVVVFPEGKSHDDPRMAPLRTGLARMALHAADRGVRGIRIVPVGLLFERKEAPRSRVLLQVGEPLDLEALRAASVSVATLTQLVQDRLEAVTLNFASAEDADRLQIVGRTLAPLLEPPRALSDGATPLGSILSIIRRLDRGLAAVRAQGDPRLVQRAEAFEQRVRAFRAQLDSLGLDVHDIAIDRGATAGAWFAIREAFYAAWLVPVGLWGRLTHWVPIQLARRLALRNVQSRDEPAMNTLVIGLALVLAAYTVQTTLVGLTIGWWWALAFLLTLVPSASSDLWYGDRTRRARERARAYRRFRAEPELQRALLAEADAIRADAAALERAVRS